MQDGRVSRRAPPERQVGAMFDDIVERYDLLNDLISFGLARGWRRAVARAVAVPPGGRVLDLGCGTGKLGALLARSARVAGVDLSHGMLVEARRQPRASPKEIRSFSRS
jgi:demethylmenaquinone methyltransferase/2-methoxy-6-polyprenyl-1,4-benzoquinol methylase